MRWLLVFLVALNAIALFWFGQQHRNSTPVQEVAVSTQGVPGITLLSDVRPDRLQLREKQQVVATPAELAPTTSPSAQLPADAPEAEKSVVAEQSATEARAAADASLAAGQCGFVGPFFDAITVRQVFSRLKKDGVHAETFSESVRRDPIFWVYLKPAKSRAEALEKLRMLHAQGVDAFIVAEGSDINAISLGFFTKKESADKIKKERSAQGFDAQVMQRERLRDQYWLVLQSAEWARFDDGLAGDLRKEYGEFTRRVRKCSVIAAYNKFE